MALSPTQLQVEFWNTECYSPKYMPKDFPEEDKYAFAMTPETSRTTVARRSQSQIKRCYREPIVNHNHLEDPLDMLMFSEGCRTASEIATRGEGTEDILIGSWP